MQPAKTLGGLLVKLTWNKVPIALCTVPPPHPKRRLSTQVTQHVVLAPWDYRSSWEFAATTISSSPANRYGGILVCASYAPAGLARSGPQHWWNPHQAGAAYVRRTTVVARATSWRAAEDRQCDRRTLNVCTVQWARARIPSQSPYDSRHSHL